MAVFYRYSFRSDCVHEHLILNRSLRSCTSPSLSPLLISNGRAPSELPGGKHSTVLSEESSEIKSINSRVCAFRHYLVAGSFVVGLPRFPHWLDLLCLVCVGIISTGMSRDKHYPSRSGQTSLATAVTILTKPVTKIYFGPGTLKDAKSNECHIGVKLASRLAELALSQPIFLAQFLSLA